VLSKARAWWNRFTLLERATAVGALATLPFVAILLVVAVAVRWPVATVTVLVWSLVWTIAGVIAVRRRRRSWVAASLDPQRGRLRRPALHVHPQTSSLNLAPSAASAALSGTVQNLAARPLDEVEAFAIHSGSVPAIRALAMNATAARLEAERLVALCAAPDFVRTVAVGDGDADAVVALLRALDAHPEPVEGLRETAFALLARHAASVSEQRCAEAARLCIESGRRGLAREFAARTRSDWRRSLLAADLVDVDEAPQLWEHAVGVLYDAAGMEPLHVRSGAGSAFERLSVDAASQTARGPVVSVVMTTWRPAAATRAAVHSVLRQTWADLELIIVDDASGPEFDDELAALAHLDERVRVVRSPTNGGTYRRRDDGIAAAQGTFIAFHDSDDLSHPRRLEVQARWLESHPAAPACVTTALRLSDTLRFSQPRGLDLRLCEPSLMVRASVLARVGSFDNVRAGGDVEFRERIASVTGHDVTVIRTAAPLTLQRWDSSSLSGGDFASGWAHPARLAYRSAHAWARRAAKPVPSAPARLRGVEPQPALLDFVIIVDARRGSASAVALSRSRRLLMRMLTEGRSIGIMHSPGPLRGQQEREFCDAYHELIVAGAYEIIAADHEAFAPVGVVLDADSLVGVSERCGLRVERVHLVGSWGSVPRGELNELAAAAIGAQSSDVLPSLAEAVA